MAVHIPVLKKEVIEYLDPKANENFIDATIGEGSFAKEILKKTSPNGKILGIDIDDEILEIARENLKNAGFERRAILVNENYSKIEKIVKEKKFDEIKGILFDLGISSWHLKKSKRGFSFRKDEPLIMKFKKDFEGPSAIKIINTWPAKEIEKILKKYGEERFAKKIAEEIIKFRKKKPILRTSELAQIIKEAVPRNYERGRIHPATRTFQALRIAVNKELENLKEGLKGAFKILKKGGRIAVISYHSLEDRIVKKFFKEKEGKILTLTKKPIRPSKKEIEKNPSSRSAKLRVGEKI